MRLLNGVFHIEEKDNHISTILIGLAPILNIFLGDAFNFISATATSMFLIIWSIMVVTHMKFRRITPPDKLPSFKMPLYPYLDILVLIFFVLMIIILLAFRNYRIPMISALIIFFVLIALTKFIREENR